MKLFSAIIIFCCVKLIALQPGEPKNRPYSLGVGAKVSETSKFYGYVFVGNDTTIQENCVFKNSSSIGANVLIMDGCQFGERVNVAAKTKIRPYCKFGDNASIRVNVFIGEHVSVGNAAIIGDNSRIGKNVFIGDYVSVGNAAIIKENAVVHNHASINRSGVQISEHEVIIKTPSSADLYENFLTKNTFCENVNLAILSEKNNVNNKLRTLMEQQSAELVSAGSNRNFSFLKKAITLYLFSYHKFEKYGKYSRIFGKYSEETSTDEREHDPEYMNVRKHLQGEIHFGTTDRNNILEPEVQDSLIRLLAIWYDSKRNDKERVENDTYCKMVEDIIINKTRDVICDIYC